MASIRNRKGNWQARITRKGEQPIAKSFQSRQDAERWARQIESEIDKGCYTNLVLADKTPFKDVINRYVQEVTSKTRSMKEDSYRLMAMARHPIAKLCMSALTPMRIAEYRDERLNRVSNGAVIRELSYFSSIINHARREWGFNMINPIPLVKKPPTPLGRNRILSENELNRLLKALEPRVKNANIYLVPIVQFALASAMRRGEILGLRWTDINFTKRIAFISMTKNGEPRTVPLSTIALNILECLPRSICGTVFPIKGPTLSAGFERAREKANIVDIHFHDLRHMAITRLAEKLPNLIELSAVSGHKSLAMLKRYYHPNPEMLALKIS